MTGAGLLMKTKTMTDFRPFRAWRYNPDKIDISKAIAPPYDVISPEGQDELYSRSGYNCIRLILNKEESGDNDKNNRYVRAAGFLKQWQQGQTLIQDETPCFYLYRQTFKDPRNGEKRDRFALLGRLKLEPFDKGVVIPHEKTLSKPKKDRRALMETTQCNLSPVFGLYEDQEHQISGTFPKIASDKPVFETEDDGILHALWTVRDKETVQAIQKGFQNQKIYIADGHHRYQTSLDYARDKRKEAGVGPGEELGSDFVLMALVEFHDPGMVLLPTHRMLVPFAGFDPAQALKALEPYFEIETMSPEEVTDRIDAAASADEKFGLVMQNKGYLLKLKADSGFKSKMPPGRADVWYDLDVNILAHFIFAALWNLPESQWESVLRFTHSKREFLDNASSGKLVAAFYLKAPEVEILRDMGNVRELMPQKSTYFYPKLASGLVFHSHC